MAGDWRAIQGNFGPRGEMMDLAGIKKYRKLEDLLADPDIDLIDVCNPTHLHPETAIRALEAGKHVLAWCRKSNRAAADGRRPDARVRPQSQAVPRGRACAAVLSGIRPRFAQAIRGGRHGKLLGGHFKRVISRPDWSADIGDVSKTGGPAVDLHIHDTHFIGLVCGVPAPCLLDGGGSARRRWSTI